MTWVSHSFRDNGNAALWSDMTCSVMEEDTSHCWPSGFFFSCGKQNAKSAFHAAQSIKTNYSCALIVVALPSSSFSPCRVSVSLHLRHFPPPPLCFTCLLCVHPTNLTEIIPSVGLNAIMSHIHRAPPPPPSPSHHLADTLSMFTIAHELFISSCLNLWPPRGACGSCAACPCKVLQVQQMAEVIAVRRTSERLTG